MTARRRFRDDDYKAIIARQKGRCALSGEPLAGRVIQFDHEIALELGGEDSLDNLRAVTAEAHKEKTRQDVKDIARAKRRARFMSEGIHRKRKGRLLQSRGFSKAKPQRTAHRPLQKWAAWREGI